MFLKNDLRSFAKYFDDFFFLVDELSKFYSITNHTSIDLLKRLLLSLYDGQAKLPDFQKVRSKIFPKPFLIAINTIFCKNVLFYGLQCCLELIASLRLRLKLVNKKILHFYYLIHSLNLFFTHIITSIKKKLSVWIWRVYVDLVRKEVWEILDDLIIWLIFRTVMIVLWEKAIELFQLNTRLIPSIDRRLTEP